MKKKIAVAVAGLAALGIAGGSIVSGAGASGGAGSRLDDGADLASKAKISEEQATTAAQGAASGALNETDLEYVDGRLVYNVDVGSHDVKVDAASGDVISADSDDWEGIPCNPPAAAPRVGRGRAGVNAPGDPDAPADRRR